ncbi:MAG TPA: hypothetical protein VF712_08370 [Thermoleophilaceae bacterium]|jgi:hypothetical protein
MTRRRWLVPVALFAGAALISGFTMLRGIDHFDEGLALQAARRVAGGELPYRDFLWSYGPASPYLLGGLFDLLGTSLVHWRVLRVLADAGVALLAFVLVRRHAGDRWALLAWLAVACQMAQPRNANPFPFALLAALGAIVLVSGERPLRTRVAWAGALTAVAAAYRIDFALYGFAAVAVMLALETRRVRTVALYAAVTAGLAVLVYAPFAVAVGPADLYEALIGTSLRERDYWTLPFPWSYYGSLGSPEGWKDALDFYVPALLLAGLAVAGAALAWRALRERRPPPPLGAGLAVLALGCLSYLLSRTDEVHTTPLFVALAVMLPLAAARAWGAGPGRARWLAYPAALVFGLLLLHGAANRGSALLRPPELAALGVGPADGVRIPPEEARAIERIEALVGERVPPGEPIYVAPARSDRVRFNDSLMYVLMERDNASRVDYGLIAKAGPQREIVADLERARPRLVVRWTAPVASEPEPNLRGRASGVRILDDWLAREYRLAERLHDYDVLVPR